MPRKGDTIGALLLSPGDRFKTALGEVEVMACYLSHGGMEVVARSTRPLKGGKENTFERLLWLYLSQPVVLTRASQNRLVEPQIRPPRNPKGRGRKACDAA